MDIYNWSPESMLEITLREPDKFLIAKETLTRIGIASRHKNQLYQTCHILHKQGRYFIVHYKEMFLLDGNESTLTEGDIQRRNTIALLLSDWELVDLVKSPPAEDRAPMAAIKVVKHKEKADWELIPKYTIGKG